MEIQKMKNEMLLKIQNRMAAIVKKHVTDEADGKDLQSLLCIMFLERFVPVCPKTGELFTEKQAIAFATSFHLVQEAMRELGLIAARYTLCKRGAYKAAKAAATTLEELEYVENMYRPRVTFVSYDSTFISDSTPEGWYEDPVADEDAAASTAAKEAVQNEQIVEILNSPRVHPLAKKIMALKLEGYETAEEVAAVLGIEVHTVRYRIKQIAAEFSRKAPSKRRAQRPTAKAEAPAKPRIEAVDIELVEVIIDPVETSVVAVETAANIITFPAAKIAKTEVVAPRRGRLPQREEGSEARSGARNQVQNLQRRPPVRFSYNGIGKVVVWNPTLQDNSKNLLWPQRVPLSSWPADLPQKGDFTMCSPGAETEGLLAWIEDNPMVTIDQIPKDIVNKLLKIAETDEGRFEALIARGLAYNLNNSGGSSGQFGGRIAPHIDNCRLRLRLASSAQGELPPLQLFSLEKVAPSYLRAVRMRNLEV